MNSFRKTRSPLRREFVIQASTAFLLGLATGRAEELYVRDSPPSESPMTPSSSSVSLWQSTVTRSTCATQHPYETLVHLFERELGRWDPEEGRRLVQSKAPWNTVERAVARMAGPRGIMIVANINQGTITSLAGDAQRGALYLVGNPVIASSILRVEPLGCLYVPFRVALFDASKSMGASISYDRPSSSLAQLNRPELVEIGRQLDEKIDSVANYLATGSA